MAEFLTGKALNENIYNVLWDAKEVLLIVCPYLDLGDYIRDSVLYKHTLNPDLHIIIIYGKKKNSIKEKDKRFFEQLKNISVIFVPNLHAKYYANENYGITTSLNLYEYSLDNNIEFGVKEFHIPNIDQPKIKIVEEEQVNTPWNFSMHLAFKNKIVFIKRPVYVLKDTDNTNSKVYVDSRVIVNNFNEFSKTKSNYQLNDIPEYIVEENFDQRISKEDFLKSKEPLNIGYCIRTGTKITYNPNKPMCKSAWESWASWSNWDFPENYCHKTGVPSKGKTSMRNPILK